MQKINYYEIKKSRCELLVWGIVLKHIVLHQTRMGGSGSNSTQDFEEALKEAEGEKAALEAANGGTLQTTTPGTDVTQPAAS